jgi:hypothetical protein
MNPIFFSRRFAIVVTALLTFALPAFAGHPRPFKGWSYEALSATPVEVGDDLFLVTDGAGRATHLGEFTRHTEVFLHPDNTIEGDVTFTTDDGYELYAHLEGVLGATVTGHYTFQGGTGRFTDASGFADFAGTSDGVSAAVSIVGKIQY